MPTLEQIRAFFAADRFATERALVSIDRADPPEAEGGISPLVVCSMPATPAHRNAAGGVMGGAIFTLADLALAVASNGFRDPSGVRVTLTSSIEFVGPCRGERLVATSRPTRAGRTASFHETRVEDDLGNLVALVTATTFRKTLPPPKTPTQTPVP